jgi:hypothetical protein
MRTPEEVRREKEAAAVAAAAQHKMLLAKVDRPAREVEAALAAVGPPGSPPLLAALATDDHALLRWALSRKRLHAIAPLLRAYGESPDACAAAMRVLDGADRLGLRALVPACTWPRADAVAALLGAYRRAGRAHAALAYDHHRALRHASNTPESSEILRLLLAEYGEPGCDAVLAGLAAQSHQALRNASAKGNSQAAALLAAAYGPPGCAALSRASLHAFKFVLASMTGKEVARSAYRATLATLLAAIGEPDCATAVRIMGRCLSIEPKEVNGIRSIPFDSWILRLEPAQRLALVPPDSLLARLAAATPAAWARDPAAARALLSAPVRSSLAQPALLALRRLPGGVAAPVAAHLRARPWLLFSGAATTALAAAAPPHPV